MPVSATTEAVTKEAARNPRLTDLNTVNTRTPLSQELSNLRKTKLFLIFAYG